MSRHACSRCWLNGRVIPPALISAFWVYGIAQWPLVYVSAISPKRLSPEHLFGFESLRVVRLSPALPTAYARESLPLSFTTRIVTGMEPPRPPASTRPPGR
jgi:hypothetical protein